MAQHQAEVVVAGPPPHARSQPRRASSPHSRDQQQQQQRFHNIPSESSAQTSASGRATPASGSASSDLGSSEGEGDGVAGETTHGRPRRNPLVPASIDPRFGDVGRGRDRDHGLGLDGDSDDEDGSEIYELKELNVGAGETEFGDETARGEGTRMGGRTRGDEVSGSRRKSGRRPSESTVASFQLYTPNEERAVVRKFDRRLVVFLAFCYMLSFVDRSNIGNARIAGMEADLQSRPPRADYFEWALRAFYIAYITFEWMSLLWRILPAHIYVSLIVLSWGIAASLQAVATSYPMLIALRVLLGIGEAGFTGVPFYLSFFFKRGELAFRTALFISAAPLASAFAGFLSWLILLVGRSLPIASWRLLFLVEGFPSVIVSTIAWGVIPDSPESASYLSQRERKIACLRLRHENSQQKSHDQSSSSSSSRPSKSSSSPGLKAKDVLAAFKDPKAWLTAFMFFLANMAYSTLPTFLPTILKDMGHSSLQAEALSAPPNLLAFGVVLITAHISDRAQARAPFIAVHALISASGYLLLSLARPLGISPMLRYMAVYPAAVGFFSVIVLIIAWSINNQPSEGRKGGGFALLQVVGQCGPLLGAQLYPDRDAPFFETGMWACAAAMLGVALLALLLRVYLVRLNKKLDREEGKGEGVEEEAEGLVNAGRSKERGFRYML
ncbi:major facilitator superfamily domain-containing protein [Xylariaceae sp. FL1651]|nr:major facilitator superfamily domain-containing protein [Xylariaceae sp. FL1651]